jgi:hypothetical protein
MAGERETEAGVLRRFVTAFERIAPKAISTGNFGWFVLLVVTSGIVWKLHSQDLKEVLLKVTNTLGWLGYPVAAITILVSMRILKWREQFYQSEMQRMAEARNQALQAKLELPLQSSSERKPH